MTVSNSKDTLWITKIPFIFEVLLCVSFLILNRASYYWMRYVNYTYGVYIFSIIIHVWAFYVLISISLKIQKKTLADVVVFKKVNFKLCLAGIVCIFGFIIFSPYVQIMLYTLKYNYFNTFASYAYYDPNRHDNLDLFLLIIDYALIPAVCEEIMCKGILFSSLKKKYSKMTGVIVTSILFAGLHLNSLMFIDHFVFSLFTFWVFFKTGNMFFPIIIHFINNLYATVTLTWDHLLDIGFLFVSVILFLLGVYFLHKVSGKEVKAEQGLKVKPHSTVH